MGEKKASVCAILLAAGASERMGEDKLCMRFNGKTPLERCMEALHGCKHSFESILVAVSELTREAAEALAAVNDNICIVAGGAQRGDSVYNALKAMKADIVVIHDAARCLVTPEIIDASIDEAIRSGSGIVGVYSRDTIRRNGAILPRDEIFLTQTPQTFMYERILKSYENARLEHYYATDDCALYERAGYTPSFVVGSIMNQKLTGRGDIAFFTAAAQGGNMQIGYGEDTHRLTDGRKLILGGVDIPFSMGLMGHSDADVLTHAVIDAMLGAAALGDIGGHFPDNDDRYRGICSLELLHSSAELLKNHGCCINNVDATVIAQEPRLAPYIDAMRQNIAKELGVEISNISVKATTPEHTGPEGRLECISARCVCSIKRM
ncbi:MAG: 2-C-methyl-D-erythritol 2,4-cyclodiphosphate synthase [Clostridia bacterium]